MKKHEKRKKESLPSWGFEPWTVSLGCVALTHSANGVAWEWSQMA